MDQPECEEAIPQCSSELLHPQEDEVAQSTGASKKYIPQIISHDLDGSLLAFGNSLKILAPEN